MLQFSKKKQLGSKFKKKSGTTSEKNKLKKKLHVLWSQIIRNNDGYVCQFCGKHCTPGLCDAHHIISKGTGNRCGNQIGHYDLRNGITLCKGCHAFGIHMRTDRASQDMYRVKTDEYLKRKGIEFSTLEYLFTSKGRMSMWDLEYRHGELKAILDKRKGK